MDIQIFQGEINIYIELFSIYYMKNIFPKYIFEVYENKYIDIELKTEINTEYKNYAITNNNTYIFYYS